jgi:hypothetical protein
VRGALPRDEPPAALLRCLNYLESFDEGEVEIAEDGPPSEVVR